MSKRFLTLLMMIYGATLSVPTFAADEAEPQSRKDRRTAKVGKLFGDSIFSSRDREEEEDHGIGVNSFLWRGSLDAISFMPLHSVDPFGGVIMTDWYTPTTSQRERFKIDVRILDRRLRVDGLRVSLFRQVLSSDNQWMESPVDPKITEEIENIILKRARDMRASEE